MMCAPCRQAGRLLTSDQSTQDYMTALHDRCEYPVSCTCAHKTVSVLDVLLKQKRDDWAGKGFTRKYEDRDA